MLIEALANLAEKMGAQRISLEIPPVADGSCAVMVVTSLGHGATVSEDKKNAALLAALTNPLVIEGHVGELDRKVVSLLDDLDDDLASASQSLPETDAQKRKRELKEAAEKKDDSKAKKSKKTATAKQPAKNEESESASDDSDDASDDAFASGEADSL